MCKNIYNKIMRNLAWVAFFIVVLGAILDIVMISGIAALVFVIIGIVYDNTKEVKMTELVGKKAKWKYYAQPENLIIGVGADYAVLQLPISGTCLKVSYDDLFLHYDVIE